MDDQLWIDHKGTGRPEAAKLLPPVNANAWRMKPSHRSCLWTSTFGQEGGWADWQDGEGWYAGDGDHRRWPWWVLEVLPEARVLEIDCYADLQELVAAYPRELPELYIKDRGERSIDFEAAARDWDGIHLTEAGQWATRLSHPLNLYSWDCESTVWFRWVFGNVRQVPSRWASRSPSKARA